jgi:hypothetical protein
VNALARGAEIAGGRGGVEIALLAMLLVSDPRGDELGHQPGELLDEALVGAEQRQARWSLPIARGPSAHRRHRPGLPSQSTASPDPASSKIDA